MRMRGATWNLDNNRRDRVVKDEVEGLMESELLDFLCYQEGQEYADNLKNVQGTSLFTTLGKGPSERDAGLLVKRRVPTRGYRLKRTHERWQRDKDPSRTHWPRSLPSVLIRGNRTVVVHMPRQNHKMAYAAVWAALLVIGIRWRRERLIMAGDWNKGAGRRGQWSPRLLAKLIGGKVYGNHIDFVIARGVDIENIHRVKHGNSDHLPVVFDVVW